MSGHMCYLSGEYLDFFDKSLSQLIALLKTSDTFAQAALLLA